MSTQTSIPEIPWMTAQEAGYELRLSKNTIMNWIQDGILEHAVLAGTSRRVFISVNSVSKARYGNRDDLKGTYDPDEPEKLPYCTAIDAAEQLGIHSRSPRRMVLRGDLPAVLPRGRGKHIPYLICTDENGKIAMQEG